MKFMGIATCLLSIMLGSIASNAYAESITCSSDDGQSIYQYNAPDGGAYRPTTVSWLLFGNYYTDNYSLPIPPTVETKIDYDKFTELSDVTEGFYREIQSVQWMEAQHQYDQDISFSGFMICLLSRYIGPPRP